MIGKPLHTIHVFLSKPGASHTPGLCELCRGPAPAGETTCPLCDSMISTALMIAANTPQEEMN